METSAGYDGLLNDADLTKFLNEMEALSSVSNATSRRSHKPPRHSRRLDIQRSKQELTDLEDQLQILRKQNEFRESLQAARSNSGLDWKKRVEAKMRRIQLLSQLIHRHLFRSVPKSVEIDLRIVDLDNQAHVYRVLQACLDSRRKGQVDDIVSNCKEYLAMSDAGLRTSQWKTFAIEDHRIGVEYNESVTIPFDSNFIQGIINENPSLNALKVDENHYVDKTTRQPISADLIPQMTRTYFEAAKSDRRLILRRVLKRGYQTIVLWEDACCWQSSLASSSNAFWIRGSGWAMIAPFEGHESELCTVQSGGFIEIHAMDGSSIKTTDVVVNDIVDYMQALQRSGIATLEAVLVNSMEKEIQRR